MAYLHDGIEGRVSPDTEVSARDIVTYGGGEHTHGDAKLFEGRARVIELQQTLERLERRWRMLKEKTLLAVRTWDLAGRTETPSISVCQPERGLPFRLFPCDRGYGFPLAEMTGGARTGK